MALINCPECGKEVSDKSEKCIHCGYPINRAKIEKYVIDGKEYDLTFVLKDYLTKKDKIKKVQTISNCSLKNAMNIIHNIYDEYNIVDEVSKTDEKKNDNKLTCPKCGSTNITEGTKGFSLMTGFIGSGNFRYVCKKCGNKWKPGSMLEILQRANNRN